MHGSLLYIMHICVITAVYGHHIWQGKDQPGQVANPARGQLAEQGKSILPCPRSRLRILSRETGSAVSPSRVSLLISILRLNLVLTYGIPPEFRGGDYRYTLCTMNVAVGICIYDVR